MSRLETVSDHVLRAGLVYTMFQKIGSHRGFFLC